MRRAWLVLVLLLAGCTGSSAPPAATPSASTSGSARPVAHPTLWLCRPGLPDNPCEGGLDATVVPASGAPKREPFRAGPTPVDCFYVYPTVSEAQSTSAPLEVTPAEVRTVRAQAARFSSVCRVFAPVYRQLTVQALLTGKFGDAKARELAHGDVVSAWHDYLDDNPDRRFVLIGHSQGSFELLRLLQEEVDGDPALRARLVSALVIGGNLKVPSGRDVGGDLQNIPLCRRPAQTGCVVAYNTYAGTPPADALFGRPDTARHLVAACTNPAALAGGTAALSPYLPTSRLSPGVQAVPGSFDTGFVTYPQYVSGRCRQTAQSAWLDIARVRAAGDSRPTLDGRLPPAWGLHVVDVSIALGDLVELVRQQTR